MLLFLRVDRLQAYLLRDLLGMNGVKAHVFNAHVSSIVGEVPPEVALPQVWLDDDSDLPRAREIMRVYDESRASSVARLCRHCSEESPGTFDLCWRCGAALE